MIYFILADHFYYAAAKYDTVVLAQAEAVAQRLRDTYRADAHLPPIRRPTLKEELLGPVEPPDQKFTMRFESDRVEVVVSGEFPRRSTPGRAWFGTAVLDFGAVYFEKPTSWGNWETQLLSVYVTPQVISGYHDDLASVFPCPNSSGACLRMTGPDILVIKDLQAAGAGRVSDEQNSYLRMLYFSAVTITTLGYGDIVPVTSTARGVVTIEIIMGPLLFGLFLNSLVKEGALPR
jgi:hypothetical protein